MIQLTPKWRKRWARFKWSAGRKFRVIRRKVFPAYRRIQQLEWEISNANDQRDRAHVYARLLMSRLNKAESNTEGADDARDTDTGPEGSDA